LKVLISYRYDEKVVSYSESSLPSLSLAESNYEDYAPIVLLLGCLHLHMRFLSPSTQNLWWHRRSCIL